jgi:hypothetical protein
MTQIPHGPDNLICPLHRSKMSKVCHTCPLWVQLRGKNPNTGAEVDQWNCSLASLPMLLVENAQQSRQNGAATESFRNTMVQLHSQTANLLARPEPRDEGPKWLPGT